MEHETELPQVQNHQINIVQADGIPLLYVPIHWNHVIEI